VYFALLGPETVNGVEFAHEENCTECGACAQVCPVDLEPRDMSGGRHREGIGFYVGGMSNFANCLRCGDCVNACEGMTDRFQKATPLRMGWLPEGSRDAQEPQVVASEPRSADAPEGEPAA
jgi:NAD-dependent dihydropyrimidine dehydrogenase PreA subunit